METLKLVRLDWLSQERDKHVWEDHSWASWDEVIGRMYLLKAHESIEEGHHYADALIDFEQALLLLAKDGVRREYYAHALADKALAQCFLGQYEVALSTIDQALAIVEPHDRDPMMNNRCAILVLAGAVSDAEDLLQARLDQSSKNSNLRFTLATCLLHLERYDDAVIEYEQAIAEDRYLRDERGLDAARRGQQPDWLTL
jgi:tetratricopeptide (TPR) repeat protein